MPIHTVLRQYKDQSSIALQQTESVTGNTEINADVAIPATTNNQQVHLAFTRANLQSVALYADAAVTIYTNSPSGSSPTDTIPLVAGQNSIWTLATNLLAKCPFTADVTTIYITNAGGATSNVKIRALANQ